MNRNYRGGFKSVYDWTTFKPCWLPMTLALTTIGFLTLSPQADAATISHTNITGGSSSFTSADGKLTLTPLAAGGGAGVFGATSGCCIGVNGGANSGGVDDIDGSPITTNDRERMDIGLASDAVLTSIGFIFTRANGPLPTDGIVISGFSTNPGASLDSAAATAGITATYNSGTVYVNHGWRGGAVSVVSFANATASRGQLLSIESNDSNEMNPQVVVNNLSYAVVPEPSTLLLAGLAMVFVTRRKK